MNNDPIPDFILNRSKQSDDTIMRNFGGSSINDPIPDFIQQRKENNSIQLENNKKDLEVKTQLGIDYDNSFSSNQAEVKAYIDALSDEDYELWDQRRQEGYSLDARKALMDNKDLLNLGDTGGSKYKINATGLEGWALNYIKNLNEGYENMHPWMEATEDWLDSASGWLEEKMGKENMMNRWIDKNDPYNKMGRNEFLANNTISSYETWVNMVQMPKVLLQTILGVASKGVDVIDNINNITSSTLAEGTNLIYDQLGKERPFDIQYGEDRSNVIGSYIQTVADGLGIGFVVAYPVATYFFTLLGAQNEDIAHLEDLVFSEKPGEAIDRLLSRQPVEDLIGIAGLNAGDQESLREALTDGLVLTLATILHFGGKKLNNAEVTKLHKEAFKRADQYSRAYAKKQMQTNYNIKNAAGTLPEGTELYNQKGKRIAVSTKEGGEFTPEGARDTLGEGIKGYSKSFKEYMIWFYRNYKKRTVERDPNMPTGELPDIKGVAAGTQVDSSVPEQKITPERQEEINEKGFYTDEKPVEKPISTKRTKIKTQEKGTTIGEFIKKNINNITGKKGGLNAELVTKLQSSKDLQNEYVNTIDPYLRENGANNPQGVIEEPLNNLVETIKDKISARRLNNQIFRKGQKQYRSEIPEFEKLQREKEDKDLKDLLKVLSKNHKDPEKFLNYLLNLPEEKIEGFNKLIPEFTQHLNLIKDTLDITKAITSSDILGKFLKFKSTWGTRNKNFIKKYIYKKLSEAYKKAGIQRNMYEIESMLNQMTEEQLIELEEAIVDDNIPAYMKEDFLNNIYDKLDKTPIEAVEGKRIGETNIQLPKKTREDIIEGELTKQGYRRETDTTTEYKTEEELRQHKLPDGTTIGDWMDRAEIHFSPTLLKDFRLSEADFWNKAINYNQRGLDMSSFVAGHEIAHFVLGKLTTAELFDLVEGIRQLTKDSGKEVNRVGMGEYLADTISNYLNHGNIDGLKNLLTENLEGPKKEITEHIQNLLDSFKKDKLFQGRAPRYESTRYQGGVTAGERMDFLRKVDPNLKDYSYDLDVNSPTFSEMKFNINDGKSLSWDEWKDTLSHDQYLKLYSSEDLFNLEKEIKNQSKKSDSWRDDIKREIEEAEAYFGKDKYEIYLKEVKGIDSDIIGLIEKDGQIYVKYLIESQRERYELPNRPGYVEVKEVPAKDYFTEEELNQLPKDLVAKIKKNAN